MARWQIICYIYLIRSNCKRGEHFPSQNHKGEEMALSDKINKDNIKTNLKYQRDKDREMVKGIFRFYEVEGGSMSFIFKVYKEDPVERYDFVDGEVYSIPLGVAKHLNKNGWYPVHVHTQTEAGKPSMKVGQKVRRFGFQSLEFVDIEDFNFNDKQIVTVDYIEKGK